MAYKNAYVATKVALTWVELPKAPIRSGATIVQFATYIEVHLLIVSCDVPDNYFTYTYRGETYDLKAKDFEKAKKEALSCAEYDYHHYTNPK